MKFSGKIRIGVPTIHTPTGARGHRVVLDIGAAADKISTLTGAAIKLGHTGQTGCRDVGTIMAASVDDRGDAGSWLTVDGEVDGEYRGLGLSWEISGAIIEDIGARVWWVIGIEKFKAVALVKKAASESEVKFEITKGANGYGDELSSGGHGRRRSVET